VPDREGALGWIALAAAVALLNVSLTFVNVWPTPTVRLTADLSVEAAVCIFCLVLARRWYPALSPAGRRWLSILWVILVIGRYVDVTTRSLYGRELNAFWDLQYVPDVVAMFGSVAGPTLVGLVLVGSAVVPILLYLPCRWAIGRISDSTDDPIVRRALGGVAVTAILFSIGRSLGAPVPDRPGMAAAVAPAYARQASQFLYEMTGAGVRALPPAPTIRSDLSRVMGADVLVVFLESYGVVSWDRPEFRDALAESRGRFAADLEATGRAVVSGLVQSTTFGGESWLAHISLLSGTEVRDQGTNVRLMGQERDTLVKAFARRGYRTVAIMPGLRYGWPAGRFYGFEEIYGESELDYHGPPFGWWDITDQFAIARMDALVLAERSRRPSFVFFPTISTHAPFTPVPPYQPDWTRVLTPMPYDETELDRAWSEQPDWMNLGPSYVRALAYAYTVLGGYLRLRDDRDFVVILLGDHQPPALVTGDGASWEVPVHVITSRPALLERLRQHGFREGLAPARPNLGPLHLLLFTLLDAFGDSE
jgi:hypothetical protein